MAEKQRGSATIRCDCWSGEPVGVLWSRHFGFYASAMAGSTEGVNFCTGSLPTYNGGTEARLSF